MAVLYNRKFFSATALNAVEKIMQEELLLNLKDAAVAHSDECLLLSHYIKKLSQNSRSANRNSKLLAPK